MYFVCRINDQVDIAIEHKRTSTGNDYWVTVCIYDLVGGYPEVGVAVDVLCVLPPRPG
jgi:hypothetical protein